MTESIQEGADARFQRLPHTLSYSPVCLIIWHDMKGFEESKRKQCVHPHFHGVSPFDRWRVLVERGETL